MLKDESAFRFNPSQKWLLLNLAQEIAERRIAMEYEVKKLKNIEDTLRFHSKKKARKDAT